jgi:type IV pilus assembly protein PilV
MTKMKTTATAKTQGGSFLLEAMIGILIFSMGILALVGLQAASINSVSESKYRTDAAFLANQIVGQMWVADRNNLGAFNTAPATWVQQVQQTLPNADTYPPKIVVAGDPINGYTVTVTVQWKNATAANPNTYTAVSFIHNQ